MRQSNPRQRGTPPGVPSAETMDPIGGREQGGRNRMQEPHLYLPGTAPSDPPRPRPSQVQAWTFSKEVQEPHLYLPGPGPGLSRPHKDSQGLTRPCEDKRIKIYPMGSLRLHRPLSCDFVVGVIQRGEDGADPHQENEISKTVSSYPKYQLDSLMRVLCSISPIYPVAWFPTTVCWTASPSSGSASLIGSLHQQQLEEVLLRLPPVPGHQ